MPSLVQGRGRYAGLTLSPVFFHVRFVTLFADSNMPTRYCSCEQTLTFRSLNRRRLLLAGLASGLLAMTSRSLAGRRVLVVGAGFAGLSAARAHERGCGGDRAGGARARGGRGRAFTDRSGGFPLDLGLAWLHGGPGNPLKPIPIEAGIASRVTDYSKVRFTDTSSGTRVRMATTELLGPAGRNVRTMDSPTLWHDTNPPPLYYAWLNLARCNGTPALVGFTSGRAAREV